MKKEILSRCGFRCDLCLAYKENIDKNDQRQILSDGWFKYFGFRIEPDLIICNGCVGDGCLSSKTLDVDCPIRPCTIEKGYENCSQCDDFLCDKFKQRAVDFGDIQKKSKIKIPQRDYKLFISPYENKKRIEDLKQKSNNFSRMLNKEIIPDENIMIKFIGNEIGVMWQDLLTFIDTDYNLRKSIIFYGKNYGWAVQYKQSNKTVLTLFPERKAFTALIIFGKKELEIIEENLGLLSVNTVDLIHNTQQFHDGKWVFLRILDKVTLNDLYALLNIKKKPNKKK